MTDTLADALPREIGAVKVKPLIWDEPSTCFLVAATDFGGRYTITEYAGMSEPFKLESVGFWNGPSGMFTTLEAAKAAAQADYEARILATIEPAPVQRCAECDCDNPPDGCNWIAADPAPVSVREAARVLLGACLSVQGMNTEDMTPKQERLDNLGRNGWADLRAIAEGKDDE